MPRPLTTLALFEGDDPLVVVGFFNYDGISIEAGIASDRPWGDRRFIQQCFSYVFDQLGCRRLLIRAEASNKRSHGMCKRLGFVVEGILREAAKDGGHVYVMAMLQKEYLESKWNGQKRR